MNPIPLEPDKVYTESIGQVSINGELIGGSDIMMDMYQSGEMQKVIDEATEESSD